MRSIICTLFEGNYHKGVAALINSLYQADFCGEIFVGYRGTLPPWADGAKNVDLKDWEQSVYVDVGSKIKVFFLKIKAADHFTNYKPTFMLDLMLGIGCDAKAIYYFDPDIVNKCSWSFYEEWVELGVAVVHEIVCNDMPASHPRRRKWMKIAEQLGYTEPQRMLNSYMNAGFVGVKREDIEFLQIWQRLIDKAADCFGLDKKKFNQSSDEFNILKAADQDLFNLTAMISKVELSEMGPEAMDFIGGGWLMSHATGSAKPWNKSFFYSFLKGRPPGGPDKLFWKFSQYPIPVFTTGHYLLKTWSIKLFSFLGRFYRRY